VQSCKSLTTIEGSLEALCRLTHFTNPTSSLCKVQGNRGGQVTKVEERRRQGFNVCW
jgi:hypothetical protein